MKKLLAAAASVFLLTAGAAFAQTDADVTDDGVTVSIERDAGLDYDTSQFVGIAVPFPASIFYGAENVDLFGVSPDLRFRFSGNFLGTNIGVGADVLFDITQIEDVIQLYAGPSLELGTVFPIQPSFGVAAILGGEYRFNREFGFFGEVGTGVSFPLSFNPRFSLGVNYHF